MTHQCKRCGHQWELRRHLCACSHPRSEHATEQPYECSPVWECECPGFTYTNVPPVRCPRCQSPYWQRDRVAKGRKCLDCDKPAGCKHTPYWCENCNKKRMERITASLEKLTKGEHQ